MPVSEIRPLLSGAPNFRDLGGHLAGDGRRLRSGWVFRSQLLADIDDEDLQIVRELGIAAVCDLRGDGESRKRRNRWPDGLVPTMIAPAQSVQAKAANPNKWLRELLRPGFEVRQARGWIMELYRQMPEDFGPHVAAVIRYLARPDSQPLLIHCEAGKDRTGFVCAVLLLALGVDEEAVYADYLLSARHYRMEALQERIHHWVGGTLPDSALESLAVLATVHADYLGTALDSLQERHGGIEAYLREGLGLGEAELATLRERLLGD